ncbi:hypothetical protein PHMEG_00041235 [Phytophthora megakarya]|uniref:Uncharacterized protein n=1 Tax=Phytophthora megakarya TaxID=4795 RepID=A0A225UBH2_9STRA|nr:hypothetical protein PHMEG_00041235 [Phytophthora megakarya]
MMIYITPTTEVAQVIGDLEALRTLATQSNGKRKWKNLTDAIVDALPAKRDSTYADTTLCQRLAKLSLVQV